MTETVHIVRPSSLANIRHKLVTILSAWCTNHPSRMTAENIAKELTAYIRLLPRFKRLSTEETGACYRHKIDMIVNSMTEVRRVIWIEMHLPRPSVEIVELMRILAQQIGRLTLFGYDFRDRFAHDMAFEVETTEIEYSSGLLSVGTVSDKEKFVRHTWDQLYQPVTFCACLQCSKRYVSQPYITDPSSMWDSQL
ncbi:hypothetical protein N7495_003059 [Penicillium taxi]|uniref:uncharacterized protein n=1 Tax=Penicillium taxi TaxID=168475 RepID=UPI002544DA94|nr:uncharacterized protein N7495_003059 [Penicillium taxi]KAJ5902531.1 hypothetical protein N7495_003059 [Penicillium taxi]